MRVSLSISMLLCSLCLFAQQHYEKDGICYSTFNKAGVYYAQITYKNVGKYSGNIVIPEYIQHTDGRSYPVRYITSAAFDGCTELESVSLPNSVLAIESRAFRGCTNLKSINIPSQLTDIGKDAFRGCNALTTLTGMSSSSVKTIQQAAFFGCTKIQSISFPNTLITVADSAFCNVGTYGYNFSISLPTSLQSIGRYAFYGSQINSINIPANVTSIGTSAFFTGSCSSITVDPRNRVYDSRNNCNAIIDTWANNLILGCNATVLPDDLESIEANAFAQCHSIQSVVIPASVKQIGSYAFYSCTSLSSVTIKGELTSIENNTFNACSIKNITLPSTVKKMGKEAIDIYNVSDLVLPEALTYLSPKSIIVKSSMNSITFPAGMRYLGSEAIYLGYALTVGEIRMMGDVPGYAADDAIGKNYSTTKLIVKSKYINNYRNTAPWSSFTNIQEWVDVASISMPKSKVLTKGERTTLSATVSPSNATMPDVKWVSSDENVATVDNGVVTAKAEGKAIIKAIAIDGSEVSGSCEVTVKDVIKSVSSISLTDGQIYSSDEYRRAGTLTYTRNFKDNTTWQALYVPFSISYNDWKNDYIVARLNAVRMYDNDEDGETDVTEIEIIKINSGTLYPNHPYFIKAKEAGQKTITLSDAVVYPSRIDSTTCSTTETEYIFKGTYSGVPGTEMVKHKYYALANGAFCYTTNVNASLGSFRWYLDIKERGAQVMYDTPAQSNIRIHFEDEEEGIYEDIFATNIASTFMDTNNSTTNNAIYSIDGRIVNTNGDRTVLVPGIYIQNNEKFIIR